MSPVRLGRLGLAVTLASVMGCSASPSTQAPAPTATQVIASPVVTNVPSLVPPPLGRIVYGRFVAQGEAEVMHAIGPGGQGIRLLGKAGDCGTCGSISRDGREVVTLTTTPDGRFTFVVLDVDTGARREYEPAPGVQFGPGPISGPTIYLQGGIGFKPPAIGVYAITAADFSHLRQVSSAPVGIQENPIAVAPDGRHLLVFNGTSENGEHGDLYLIDSAGGGLRRLNPDGTHATWIPSPGVSASFSPDSKRVAFAAYVGDQGQNADPDNAAVYVADVAGGAPNLISAVGTGTSLARWSPTGDWIAFQRRTTGIYSLYLIHPDGTAETRIDRANADPGISAWAPVWSPDGMWLVFQRGSVLNYDLWLVHPDGTGLAQLTADPAGYGGVLWGP